MTDLSELLERMKAATGPDRELDGDIAQAMPIVPEWCAGHRDPNHRHVWTDGARPLHAEQWIAPEYTSSIDAALALVERCLPGFGYELAGGHFRDSATIFLGEIDSYEQRSVFQTYGATLPLAILSALLQALGEAP